MFLLVSNENVFFLKQSKHSLYTPLNDRLENIRKGGLENKPIKTTVWLQNKRSNCDVTAMTSQLRSFYSFRDQF